METLTWTEWDRNKWVEKASEKEMYPINLIFQSPLNILFVILVTNWNISFQYHNQVNNIIWRRRKKSHLCYKFYICHVHFILFNPKSCLDRSDGLQQVAKFAQHAKNTIHRIKYNAWNTMQGIQCMEYTSFWN